MSLFNSKNTAEASTNLYPISSEETTEDYVNFREEHCILKSIKVSICTESPYAIRLVDFYSDCKLDSNINNDILSKAFENQLCDYSNWSWESNNDLVID